MLRNVRPANSHYWNYRLGSNCFNKYTTVDTAEETPPGGSPKPEGVDLTEETPPGGSPNRKEWT